MPHHLRLWWSLGFALLALITALSLLPIRGPDLDLPNSDKLNHALAYSVLMLYFGQLVGGGWRRRLAVAAGLLAYGIAIELLQSQLPPRTAELADLAANIGGMAIGALLLRTALGRLLLTIEGRLPGRTRL
jgi:VanZ family protein